MYVHNYIPEPLEVPGNVTEAPYAERLNYIRRVGELHGMSVAAVAAVALWAMPHVPVAWSGVAFLAMLVGLDVVRIRLRGRHVESTVSAWALPILIVVTAAFVRSLSDVGIPVWALGTGLAAALAYAGLCGRDFSFVGQYALSLIVSSVSIAGIAVWQHLPRGTVAAAIAINTGYLSFSTYDMASLLSRRRRGEEFAAVVDLYRDVLNIFGYTVRVARHWRKYRIWTGPK